MSQYLSYANLTSEQEKMGGKTNGVYECGRNGLY